MRLVQSNSLRSFDSVGVVLDTYKPIWTSLPGFGKAVTEFHGLVKDIKKQAVIQLECDLASKEKAAVREALGTLAHEVSGAVQAWAVESGDLALEARVDFSRSAIVVGKQDQVLSRCRAIHTVASDNLAHLADNGITAAKLAEFEQQIDAFEQVQPKPRNRRSKGRAATQALEILFHDAGKVLRKRIDKLVPQFAATAPEFVKEYEAARVVVDLHGPGQPDEPAPVPAKG